VDTRSGRQRFDRRGATTPPALGGRRAGRRERTQSANSGDTPARNPVRRRSHHPFAINRKATYCRPSRPRYPNPIPTRRNPLRLHLGSPLARIPRRGRGTSLPARTGRPRRLGGGKGEGQTSMGERPSTRRVEQTHGPPCLAESAVARSPGRKRLTHGAKPRPTRNTRRPYGRPRTPRPWPGPELGPNP
jgi:hypothetical protein